MTEPTPTVWGTQTLWEARQAARAAALRTREAQLAKVRDERAARRELWWGRDEQEAARLEVLEARP